MTEHHQGARPRLVLCPPVYFDVEYSINPWMDTANRVDKAAAQVQWDAARALLAQCGACISVLDPVPGWPDMTFVGDAGLCRGNVLLASRFRHPERAGETEHYIRYFRGHGYDVRRMPEGVFFEGLGDVSMAGNVAVFAHGPRSSPAAAEAVRSTFPELELRAELELTSDRFYHLGLALALLDEQTVMYYPPAFSVASQQRLEQAFPRRVVVDDEDAVEHVACNNVTIGRNVILDGCSPALERTLQELGFQPRTCPMSEFKKSGGSVRCLVETL